MGDCNYNHCTIKYAFILNNNLMTIIIVIIQLFVRGINNNNGQISFG